MNLSECNPKKYTTEDLQDIKKDLRNLLMLVDEELNVRKLKRFEELVGNVLTSFKELTAEFPNWATNFELTLTAENWQREYMELSDFFLE